MREADWERVAEGIEQECRSGWSKQEFFGFELRQAVDLFLRVVRAPVDQPELRGLADKFGQALLDGVVEYPSTPGELGNAFDALHMRYEPFLRKVLLLARPQRYSARSGLNDLIVALELPRREPGSPESRRAHRRPREIDYAFVRARNRRNRSAHSTHEIRPGEYWREVGEYLLACLWVACRDANSLVAAMQPPEELEEYARVRQRMERELRNAWARDPGNRWPRPLEVGLRLRRASAAGDATTTEPALPEEGDALHVWRAAQRLVILGAPGSGKTTQLRHLAWALADGKIRKPVHELPLPVFVEMRRLTSDRPLEALLREQVVVEGELGGWLRDRDVLLLVDGVNEVLDADLRRQAIFDLEDWMARYSGLQVVVSARPWNRQLPDLPVYRIDPLDDDQRGEYLTRRLPGGEGARTAERLRKTAPRLWDLARTPFLLEMLAGQIGEGGRVPSSPGELIGGFLVELLKRSTLHNADREISRKERLLADLGFETRRAGMVSFTEDFYADVVSATARALQFEVDPYALRDEFFHDGVLRVDGVADGSFRGLRHLSFEHESFQEYFAARGLLRRAREEPELLKRCAVDPDWREPLEILRELPGAPRIPEPRFEEPQPDAPAAAPAPAAATAAPSAKPDAGLRSAIRNRDAMALVRALRPLNEKKGRYKLRREQARGVLEGEFAAMDDPKAFGLDCLERLSGSDMHSYVLSLLLGLVAAQKGRLEASVRTRAWALYVTWRNAQRHRPAPFSRALLVASYDLGADLDSDELREISKHAPHEAKSYLGDRGRWAPPVRGGPGPSSRAPAASTAAAGGASAARGRTGSTGSGHPPARIIHGPGESGIEPARLVSSAARPASSAARPASSAARPASSAESTREREDTPVGGILDAEIAAKDWPAAFKRIRKEQIRDRQTVGELFAELLRAQVDVGQVDKMRAQAQLGRKLVLQGLAHVGARGERARYADWVSKHRRQNKKRKAANKHKARQQSAQAAARKKAGAKKAGGKKGGAKKKGAGKKGRRRRGILGWLLGGR